ncbi:DUF4369 domain-containing protein [Sediminibacter sp. Hel_I_10]|uniref:DUF4369 domain-containing protein n=1 Tax=Sediminibacter sp. Hel_I_10 TaxID=1392490 RepID=UPI00047C9573|nr:DUF4369 domain-containing protein [Sediminibacter sp. Hel_I_10]
MKQFAAILITILLYNCASEEQHDFTLKGHIEGLKKGTVYLQKQTDSVMVTLDSLEINGNSMFELHAALEEPELLFLKLDKNDDDEGTVVFFADKGITEVNSTLKTFNYDAKIKGSKQQDVLEEYLLMMSKFNDKNLDMIKESFESQIAQDSTKYNNIQANFDNLLKRKYLYTINFAVNHKDSEVAPYLAISEISNTSVKYLEEIYNALDAEIKTSKYGIELEELIALRKAEAKNQ